jgi:hypothetical protein
VQCGTTHMRNAYPPLGLPILSRKEGTVDETEANLVDGEMFVEILIVGCASTVLFAATELAWDTIPLPVSRNECY